MWLSSNAKWRFAYAFALSIGACGRDHDGVETESSPATAPDDARDRRVPVAGSGAEHGSGEVVPGMDPGDDQAAGEPVQPALGPPPRLPDALYGLVVAPAAIAPECRGFVSSEGA